MIVYEYRCDRDGVFELLRPLGAQPASTACPVCRDERARGALEHRRGEDAPRPLVAAIDHAEKSRTEPEVVTSLPPSGRRRRTPVVPLTPTLRRLPRP